MEILQGLRELPEKIKKVLELDGQIKELAKEMKDNKSILVMGRGYNYATCMEGALVSQEQNDDFSCGFRKSKKSLTCTRKEFYLAN